MASMTTTALTIDDILQLLLAQSPRAEAVFLALGELGRARTNEVADRLGLDRANTGKYLDLLADLGRVAMVDDCDHDGGRGRPSRVWEVA